MSRTREGLSVRARTRLENQLAASSSCCMSHCTRCTRTHSRRHDKQVSAHLCARARARNFPVARSEEFSCARARARPVSRSALTSERERLLRQHLLLHLSKTRATHTSRRHRRAARTTLTHLPAAASSLSAAALRVLRRKFRKARLKSVPFRTRTRS